jgi:hypothetical protein
MLVAIAGMTGVSHHTQLFAIEMGSHELFCFAWACLELWFSRSQPPK